MDIMHKARSPLVQQDMQAELKAAKPENNAALDTGFIIPVR